MHILTISSFVAGAAGFSFMAPPTGNHMVGALSMKGAFACTNHAGFSGARCGPAITMAETKPEGERKLPLRSAFLGLIALQSIAALSTEIPGLLSENPAYFGTAVDAAFLAYATNILLQQAGVVRGASMPPETIASVNGFECGATLSIGRETGTWMPQEWAASGARLSLPLTLRFSDEEVDLGFPGEEEMGGRFARKIYCDGGRFVGPQGEVVVKCDGGGWAVLDEKGAANESPLRMYLDFPEEAARNDVSLPAGRVYFSTVLWQGNEAQQAIQLAEAGPGGVMSVSGGKAALLTQGGGLTIKRNSARNLWGGLGDVFFILGKFTLGEVKKERGDGPETPQEKAAREREEDAARGRKF